VSIGKDMVETARAGLQTFLVDLLRGKEDLPREVRDYLADILTGKEKIKRVKLPSLNPEDVMVILSTWARYTDPEVISRARDKRQKNLYGPKRAIADLVDYFARQNMKVSAGTILDVIYHRKSYAGRYNFEYSRGKWKISFVNSGKMEKVSSSPKRRS